MKLVSQAHFDVAQKEFVENFRNSVNSISSQTDIILGAKDIHSRHIVATDAYARLVALTRGSDVADRLDSDMPCEGTAKFADCYVREDQELLHQTDYDHKKSILNIHEYAHGIDALLFQKSLLIHYPSASILGTIYTGYKIEISRFLTLVPNYILEFGAGCSIENASKPLSVGREKLTEYEREVCFLVAMNWDPAQILNFMNDHRPLSPERSRDSMYKCRARICEKLNCQPSNLREMLIAMGIHRQMPSSFFRRMIGSRDL